MGEKTGIAWCDHTFNTHWGCTKVSPGCDFCYAERDSKRHGFEIWGKYAQRRMLSDHNWNEPLRWNRRAEKEGQMKRVFCGSMCDILEERDDLDPLRERLWNLIDVTPWLIWLLVSKRAQNFLRMVPARHLDSPRVWPITTVESGDYLWRAEALLRLASPIIGISYEPALQDVSFINWMDAKPEKKKWVIFGGESGREARVCDPAWALRTVRESRATGTACFVKQLGSKPLAMTLKHWQGADPAEWPDELRIREFPILEA
jgi:protein gp37